MSRKTYYGSGRFNMSLYKLRESRGWTQAKMAEVCGGYDGHTLNRIENGISYGNLYFWMAVKHEFGISDEDMWLLQTASPKFDYKKYADYVPAKSDVEFVHHGRVVSLEAQYN